MATRKSASSGMYGDWESSASRSSDNSPRCACSPWQAWIRNTLGLLVRADWSVALKVLVICLMGRDFPSIPLTTPLSPWLKIQQMKASPCLSDGGASLISVNSVPDHSFTLNSCSWERSLREAKHFSAWSIWSLGWSLHISTLKPSQLNTSAKLSARHVIKQMYLGLNYHQISQQCIPVNPSTLWHTGIFVGSTSLIHIREVLVVHDDAEASGPAVQLVLISLETTETVGHKHINEQLEL